MPGAHNDLLALLLLLAGSLLSPILARRIFVPAAVVLISFGLIVGPNGIAWLHQSDVVAFLSEFGFIVLMFLAGLEIDFNAIRSRGRTALLTYLAICLTIFSLAFVASALLRLHPIFGLVLGAMSVGLPLAVLKETNQVRSAVGQAVLLLASIGEFMTLVGITLFYFVLKFGWSLQLLFGLGKLVGVLAVAGLALRLFTATAWWYPERFAHLVDTRDNSEIGVRASLLLMVSFSVLAMLAGVESIVGAFMAGALIAFVLRGKEILEHKLAVVGHGLFVPLFFIIVGARFDTTAVTQRELALVATMLLVVVLARLLPSLALLRLGLPVRDMLGAAGLLAAPLTLLVAIAELGRELGVLDSRGHNSVVILALCSAVLFPVLFRFLGGRGAADE